MEPKWLLWARELQAMAQTGLAFTKNAYDCQRYERLRELAAQMMAEHAGVAGRSAVQDQLECPNDEKFKRNEKRKSRQAQLRGHPGEQSQHVHEEQQAPPQTPHQTVGQGSNPHGKRAFRHRHPNFLPLRCE